jgi:hypothetical protein
MFSERTEKILEDDERWKRSDDVRVRLRADWLLRTFYRFALLILAAVQT